MCAYLCVCVRVCVYVCVFVCTRVFAFVRVCGTPLSGHVQWWDYYRYEVTPLFFEGLTAPLRT